MAGRALKPAEALETVRGLLTKARPQLTAALPKHLGGVDRFTRIALTACQKQPQLLECAPMTFIGALLQSAQLGLEVSDGTGKAWLVPFFNNKKGRREVQLIIGYRGMIDLARRGMPAYPIEARVVCEGDTFSYAYGTKAGVVHVPADPSSGKPTHFYAVARFPNGTVQFDVMTKVAVDRIRARAKAQETGPWNTDYEEMGKKTVVRRICKLLPCSVELLRAIDLDERHELGKPQDLGTLATDEEFGTVIDGDILGDEEPAPVPSAAKPAAPGELALKGASDGERLWNALMDDVGGNNEEASNRLEQLSAFKGRSGIVPGVRDWKRLSDGRAKRTLDDYLKSRTATA